MNKKKIIIIAASVAVFSITITSILALSMMDEWNTSPGDTPDKMEEGSVGQISEPEYEGDISYEEVESIVGDKDGAILQEGQAQAIAVEARRLMSEYKFQEAETYILDSVKDYNALESSYYQEYIEPLRLDIPALSQIDYLYEYGDAETIKDIISNLNDPVNIVIANLWLEPQIREGIIINKDSLNPTFDNITEIGSVERKKEQVVEFPEAEDMYVVEFSLDGNSLKAKIVDAFGWLYLYSIESESENHPYITINEWNKYRDEVNNLINPDNDEEEEEFLEISESETLVEEEFNEDSTEN